MTTTSSQSGQHDAPRNDPRQTPAMRQYYAFKEKHPECVLFFRMGDFYEMFDEDAKLCHKVLGITLTQRTKGVPMAGVPYHAAENYLRRMIEQGYRVAVCEQVQDPKEAKGVVDRAVTRVVTPGTLVDETLLDDGAANTIAAIQFTESGDDAGGVLALAELSTGSFTLHTLPGSSVVDEVERLGPAELLYVETADGNVPERVNRLRRAIGCALTARPAWTFRLQEAHGAILEHFGVRTLTGFGLDDDDPAIGPAGALLRYLQETQTTSIETESDAPDSDARARLAHIRPPRRDPEDQYVVVDATSLRSLEIEKTMRTGETTDSLLATLQRCRSPMGKRLLRQWLCFPLRDVQRIRTRQDAVSEFMSDADFSDSLSERIASVQDVARIAGRIALQRATPRDLVALGRSVRTLDQLLAALVDRPAFVASHERLEALAASLNPLAEMICSMCVDDPPNHLREGGLFRDGADAQLDEARSLQRDGNAFLASYQKELIESIGIPNLKIGFNKVFGYFIEVTRAQASRMPDSFTRKQTLKNAERYITPKLKDFEDRITSAETRAIEREQRLFDRLCNDAASHTPALTEFAEIVAELDVLLCFAENALRYNLVRPELTEEPYLDIEEGRHPVLDRILTDAFVPNDCALGVHPGAVQLDDAHSGGQEADAGETLRTQGAAAASLALITGPNMAGKSTYIRQIALITLLAHTGSFVPASRARVGVVDRIFTRIGANDELHAGQSTFMVEMTETANILHHATEQSLVILDEIGRGTSTLDGLSLAWAIAESLADVGCRTFFATHYHEMTTLAETRENVMNLHVAVREWGDEIIFLYRILPGRADRSYGIHVAKLAGLPTSTIARARSLLETLAVKTEHEMPREIDNPRPTPHDGQLGLFTEYIDHPVVGRLRELDIDRLAPIEAFDALRTLREMLDD